MTTAEKLSMLKSLLKITDTSLDAELAVYLDFTKKELIFWRYGSLTTPPIARAKDSEDNLVLVSVGTFIGAISPTSGTSYAFTYAGDGWQYASADIELADYGLFISDTITPIEGETITVKYTETPLVEFDTVQIAACMAGYSISGAEGQTSHTENTISRVWKYEDMVSYIRQHVSAYARLV